MLELLSFHDTKKRTHHDIVEGFEHLGGMIQAVSSKETILYCADVLRQNVNEAMEIFSDAVLNPLITEDEVEEGKEVMQILRTELPSEALSKDAVQVAAYRRAGDYQRLGNAHYANEHDIPLLNAQKVRAFRERILHGDNCVLSAAGIEHDVFVKLCDHYFGSIPRRVSPGAGRASLGPAPTFQGGLVLDQRELKDHFVKTCVAFEVGGWHDSMLVPAFVMQQILGGGSSFSAGGPGKGMYTRLYKGVLSEHYWVEAAQSFLTLQEQAGLIGIDGASHAEHTPQMLRVIIDQLFRFAVEPVSAEELARGKNMLKSMMLMNLESRLVLCEDLARQTLTYGKRVPPNEICAKVDAVTPQDIMAVGQRLLSAPGMAVACVGHDVSSMVNYNDIQHFLSQYKAYINKYGKLT